MLWQNKIFESTYDLKLTNKEYSQFMKQINYEVWVQEMNLVFYNNQVFSKKDNFKITKVSDSKTVFIDSYFNLPMKIEFITNIIWTKLSFELISSKKVSFTNAINVLSRKWRKLHKLYQTTKSSKNWILQQLICVYLFCTCNQHVLNALACSLD